MENITRPAGWHPVEGEAVWHESWLKERLIEGVVIGPAKSNGAGKKNWYNVRLPTGISTPSHYDTDCYLRSLYPRK